MASRKEVKLLVVDDRTEQFEQIQSISEMYHSEYKIECKLATTEVEARSLLSSWQPSVVLVDLHVGSGSIPLLDYISETGCAPVVATSDVLLPELEVTAESHGAVGYVPKGEDQEEVEALVDFLASVAHPVINSH